MSEEVSSEVRAPSKAVQLALDFVEPGDESLLESRENLGKKLPEGISSKQLYKDIVHIAWPSFIEMVLTQLVSMVDMMMVGRLGVWAITATGLTIQPKFLLMTLFMSMNVGATALVARYKGEGNQEKANNVLRQALLMTFCLSVVGSVIGYIFAEPLVKFMGAEEGITLANGVDYFRIQMIGFVFLALTSTMTATLRGVGSTRIAMIYNLISNLVNVCFNFLLIYGYLGFPRLEVVGASIATVIGQCTAFVIALTVVLKGNHYMILRLKDGFKPDWATMKSIANIGIPAAVEQLVMRAGMIIYVKTVASLGTLAYAIHQTCMNIQAMSFMTGQAFAVSATSLVGQSLGKKRPDFAEAYSRRTRRIGMVFSIFLGLSFILFGKYIVALYNTDPDFIKQGAKILMFVAFCQPFQSSQFILAGALRGAGDTRSIAVISFITVLLVRPGLAIIAIRGLGFGLEGAWLALIADQLLRSLLVFLRYNSGKWKTIKV